MVLASISEVVFLWNFILNFCFLEYVLKIKQASPFSSTKIIKENFWVFQHPAWLHLYVFNEEKNDYPQIPCVFNKEKVIISKYRVYLLRKKWPSSNTKFLI